MVDRQIIDEWLSKAEDDFRFAEMVLSEEKEYYDQINKPQITVLYCHGPVPERLRDKR